MYRLNIGIVNIAPAGVGIRIGTGKHEEGVSAYLLCITCLRLAEKTKIRILVFSGTWHLVYM